jgi:multidrug resistance protein, MATE family
MRRDGGWKGILALALPVVISKLSFTAMGLVDTAMVGRLGTVEQGAVGIATTYMFTIYVFGLGLLGVVNTYVSQYHGAGRERACGLVLGQGVRLAVIAGSITLAIVLASAPLFRMAGLSDVVSDLGYRYMFWRSLGVAGVFGYWAYNGFLEGIGQTRTPMIIALLANVVNMVLDVVLIFGLGPIPALGVDGAGIATAASNLFMLGCFLWLVHRRSSPYRRFGVDRVRERIVWPLVRGMIRVGTPMGLQFFFEVGAYLVISIMVGWIGDIELSANQVAVRLLSISFMTAWGISVAATTLVGRHQGEGRSDLAARDGWRTLIIVGVFSLFCAAFFAGMPGVLARLLAPYEEVATLVIPLLYVAAVYQILDGLNMVAYGALRGAGDTRWPMWAVVFTSWCIGIPVVYLLAIRLEYGILGAWLGMLIMITLQATLLVVRFARGPWRTMTVVDEDDLPDLDLVVVPGGEAERRTA